MFQICAIGCGAMANRGHGPAFQKYTRERADVCLAACCDIDEARAKEFCEKFGFEAYYTDYLKMIREVRPDVVSLMSPPHLTCEMASKIMKMGCNIILEKPPGRDRAEILQLASIAREAGVHVRVAFNRRYIPLLAELKRRLAERGEPVIAVTYQMYRHNRLDDDFSTTAIHAVDAAKYIVGSDYGEVCLHYTPHPALGTNVKSIFLDARFENGAVAQITVVPIGGAVTERITVNTQGSTYSLELPVWNNFDVPGRLTCSSNPKLAPETVTGDLLSDSTEMFELSGFYRENEEFFDRIRAGGAASCDLESAIQSVELEDCIRHSVPIYCKNRKGLSRFDENEKADGK